MLAEIGAAVGEISNASVVNSTDASAAALGFIVKGNALPIRVGKNLGTFVELCTLKEETFLTVVTLLSKNSCKPP